ncbi:MAG: signal peptidase I [Bacilli bacterium]|nr:signal peptidase I [Bacilli bacterium]
MSKNIRLIILSAIVLFSVILEITGYSVKLGSSYVYVLKPLMWLFIGVVAFIFFRNEIITNKKYKKEVEFCVVITTLVYFLIYFILGYIKGFAHNPYDQTFSGILTNLWSFIPAVIIREYVRYYMINNCGKKNILLWAFLISLLFTFIDLNLYKFDSYFATTLTTIEFFMQTFIPSLITNLYLTYISYFSGFGAPILYAILPQLIMYIIPILPDIDWATTSILSATVPFFSYIYINYQINKADKTIRKGENKTVGIKGWLSMMLVIMLMICFGLGVFPFQPLVIGSNSMAPKIHKGDIVIIQDKDVKDVKKGDVIRYLLDGNYVVHRVVMINQDAKGKKVFITKGDNNNDIDLYPVKEYQYTGVVKVTIPYLGYPTIILRELLSPNAADKVNVEKGKN